MTNQQWIEAMVPFAQAASSKTGLPVSLILAQWADETAYGSSEAFRVGNNPAGISPGGTLASYPNLITGVQAYIDTMNDPIYAPVRQEKTTTALGQSPWAASHYDMAWYNNNALPYQPGIDLTHIINASNLTQYDGTVSPLPLPLPKEPPTMDNLTFIRWCYLTILLRAPDEAGFATWNDYLAGGGSREQMIASFMESDEGKTVLNAQRKTFGL